MGIEVASVPADDLDLRVTLQPVGGRGGRAIRQYVKHLSTLQIDQDRPIRWAFSPVPVSGADHPDRPSMANGSRSLQRVEQGVVALGQKSRFISRSAGRPLGRKVLHPADVTSITTARWRIANPGNSSSRLTEHHAVLVV